MHGKQRSSHPVLGHRSSGPVLYFGQRISQSKFNSVSTYGKPSGAFHQETNKITLVAMISDKDDLKR